MLSGNAWFGTAVAEFLAPIRVGTEATEVPFRHGMIHEALRIAALGHDIERAVEARKVRRGDFADYDAFKAAHARNSAAMLGGILRECGVGDETLTREVHRLVCVHEVGGDLRSDLLKDADSLSYFDVNLPLYFERNGWQETQRRCVWGYRRLSERARSMAAGLTGRGKELDDLMDEAIREAGWA